MMSNTKNVGIPYLDWRLICHMSNKHHENDPKKKMKNVDQAIDFYTAIITYIQEQNSIYGYYVNGVTLREQNPPLKYCQSLKLLTYFERGLDLSMQQI